jgi:hypothetical protein
VTHSFEHVRRGRAAIHSLPADQAVGRSEEDDRPPIAPAGRLLVTANHFAAGGGARQKRR